MSAPGIDYAAPASAAGILFQVQRTLQLLITDANADQVAFEVLDDVAALLRDGTKYVEQNKYSTIDHKLTNESDALWNTVWNWMKLYTITPQPSRDGMSFCIVTNTGVPAQGSLVRALAKPAKSAAAVAECIQLMGTIHKARVMKRKRRTARNRQADQEPKDDDVISAVLGGDRSALNWVVERMSVVFSAGVPTEEDRRDLARRLWLGPDDSCSLVLDALLGWLCRTILEKIDRHETCWITRVDFSAVLAETRQRHPMRPARVRPQSQIPGEERARLSQTDRLFVRRLEEVDHGALGVQRAEGRYLNHRAELLHLANAGAILETPGVSADSYSFYSELHDRWESVYCAEFDHPSHSDIAARGRYIFASTLTRAGSASIAIGRIDVGEEYFLEGGLHVLANREHPALDVWWLPIEKAESAAALPGLAVGGVRE